MEALPAENKSRSINLFSLYLWKSTEIDRFRHDFGEGETRDFICTENVDCSGFATDNESLSFTFESVDLDSFHVVNERVLDIFPN